LYGVELVGPVLYLKQVSPLCHGGGRGGCSSTSKIAFGKTLYSVTFFSKNRSVYEIMWENMIQPDRPQAGHTQVTDKSQAGHRQATGRSQAVTDRSQAVTDRLQASHRQATGRSQTGPR
jgi:hypothetical protein